MNREIDWTADVVARLRVLWAEGHSTAEIGRRMGLSKNAVIGKAHRLALPARPNPIRGKGIGRKPRTRTPPRAEMVKVPRAQARGIPSEGRDPSLPPLQTLGPAPVPVRVPTPVLVPAPVQRPATVFKMPETRHPCCWPIGEPGTPSFRYCDAPAKPGKPYCPEHAAVAYVRPYAQGARGDGTNSGV